MVMIITIGRQFGSGGGEVIFQGRIGDALADEGGDGDNGTGLQGEQLRLRPDLAEKYIVVQFCEFRGEFPKGVPPCGLLDCHIRLHPVY